MTKPAFERMLLDPHTPKDRKMIRMLEERKDVQTIDMLSSELEELYRIRHPETIREGVQKPDVDKFINQMYASGGGKAQFGTWVWYPWRSGLIRFLPEALHTELRTSRNRNLITEEEQKKYYESHIGVAGLSVGNSVVATILHAGGAKHMRIADGDVMSGSNTNRIRAGFDTIGLSKTTVMLREIYLTNPYAQIDVYAGGITLDTLERFLTYPKPLDVVIDEMDDLYLKIQLRVYARRYKIPVVMAADNGDGIVVDIERFDLEPNRLLMHGDIPESELLSVLPNIPRPVAAKIISSWVKPENIAQRMMTSILELGKTLYTWPQLGSAATMAGGIVAYIARRIVVGQPVLQGKFIFEPDALFVPNYHSLSQRSKRRHSMNTFNKQMGLS